MLTNDEIVREMVVPAPPARVWTALTTAEQLSKWFGSGASVDLRVGGAISFQWEEFDDEAPGVIEEIDEPRRFVFRWKPFGHMKNVKVDPSLSTRVAFDIEPHAEGSLVRVRETGFAALPEAIASQSFKDNTSGWESEFADLLAYLS